MYHTGISLYSDTRNLYRKRVEEIDENMKAIFKSSKPEDHIVTVIGASLHGKAQTPLGILTTFHEKGYQILFVNTKPPNQRQVRYIDWHFTSNSDK